MKKKISKSKKQTIVVAGDVTIDWLQWGVEAQDSGVMKGEGSKSCLNWKLYRGTRMVAQPGGVLLLAQMIEEARPSVRVAAPVLPKPIEDINRKKGSNLPLTAML